MESKPLHITNLETMQYGDIVFVQREFWGPPKVGKFLKFEEDYIHVSFSDNPQHICKYKQTKVFANWMDSIVNQMNQINFKGKNDLMKPLGLALLKCFYSNFLPNSNFFRREVNQAAYLHDIDKTIEDVITNGRTI